MSTIRDIMNKYTLGELEADQANEQLADLGAAFHLEPGKNDLTEAEKYATVVGYYPEQTSGFGLLDTGTGTLDKVRVRHGRLVDCDCGDSYALCFVAGRMFHVSGAALTN